MIYVDDLFEWPATDWRTRQWCHMWSDVSAEELVAFAERLGLKAQWLQHRGQGRFKEHFDLRPSKRVLAVQKGATEIKATEFIRIVKERLI